MAVDDETPGDRLAPVGSSEIERVAAKEPDVSAKDSVGFSDETTPTASVGGLKRILQGIDLDARNHYRSMREWAVANERRLTRLFDETAQLLMSKPHVPRYIWWLLAGALAIAAVGLAFWAYEEARGLFSVPRG